MATIIDRLAVMTVEQRERMDRDIAFMQSPAEWPRWPLLPLVNRTGQMSDDKHTALMFADGTPTIYYGLLWMLPKAQPGQTWGEVLGTLSSRTFPTFEHLAAEFRVD